MNARRCPRCTFTLVPQPVGGAEIDLCPRCRGSFLELGEHGALLGRFGDFSEWALSGAARSMGEGRLRCPLGHGRMQAWRVNIADGGNIEVDTCSTCRGLWLDAREELILKRAGGPQPVAPLPRFGPDLRLNEPPAGQEKTGVGWYLFQLFTAMPVEVHNPKRQSALVCLLLIATCVVAFVAEIALIGAGGKDALRPWVVVPEDVWAGRNLASLLTHMFLHGGLAHLLGNLWFLWTFGDNVEDRVGRARFLALYLLFGFAAVALQLPLLGAPDARLLGASGAIAGLMGAYLGLFPRAHLYQVFLFIRWRLPAWFYLGGWFALNTAIGVAELNHSVPDSHVAWWAHVGGFVAGLGWALLLGRRFRDGAELSGAYAAGRPSS